METLRREATHPQVSGARARKLLWFQGRPQVPGAVAESLLTTPSQGCQGGKDKGHNSLLPPEELQILGSHPILQMVEVRPPKGKSDGSMPIMVVPWVLDM